MSKEIYDGNMDQIKLGTIITDGTNKYTVERIAMKLSIAIEGRIIPLERLPYTKIDKNSNMLKKYTKAIL